MADLDTNDPQSHDASGTAPGSRRHSLRLLWHNTPVRRASLGCFWGWGLVALFTMNVLLWSRESPPLPVVLTALGLAALAAGGAAGAVLARRLSARKVEWGLVPPGLGGVALAALVLGYARPGSGLASVSLLVLGGMVALALTPSLVFLARHPAAAQLRGARYLFSVLGMLAALGMVWGTHVVMAWPVRSLFHIGGGLALLGCLRSLYLVPALVIRLVSWLVTHTLYRIRIVGQEHIPEYGPALLICNHMSFVDAFLVGACMQRLIRFMMYRPFYEIPVLHGFFRLLNAIPIAPGERSEVQKALELPRQELLAGHVVCIFAEGAISRTGNLLRFRRGFETILHGLDVPVIPVHLDRLWGSPLSFRSGRLLWQWPRQVPYPVTVSFGAPLPATVRAPEARQAIMELGSQAVAYRRLPQDLLHRRFLRTARRRLWALCMADASGQQWRGYQALARLCRLVYWLRGHGPEEERIGLALPASATAALMHVALLCAGKVPVPLGLDRPRQTVEDAIQQCGLRTVIVCRESAAFFQNMPQITLRYLEDASQPRSRWQGVWTTLLALTVPSRLWQHWYTHPGQHPGAVATVVFTAGTTGKPRGVLLSHHNILSNLESIEGIFELTRRDCLLGTLPLHHAFGITVTLWLPLISGFAVLYQANPLDVASLMRQMQRYQATLLVSTPAGYAHYLQHCPASALTTVRHALSGADHLAPEVAAAFQATYGLPLLEGYGCTEMAPVIAVNVPDAPYGTRQQTGFKTGTVGHPVPGVAVKVVHPHTGAILPYGVEGAVLAQGSNCMLGYLDAPHHTSAVLRDGWFVTGDTGILDEDGFLRITGRLASPAL